MLSPHANAEAPEGCRIYAVGDIHGRADLLDVIIGRIVQDDEARKTARPILIFLGDYIDRGPASKSVIDRLASGMPPKFEAYFLMGNHEDLLLTFLDDPLSAPNWLRNGADATLLSYGIDKTILKNAMQGDARSFMLLRSEFLEKLPQSHLEFYRSLGLFRRFGDYYFVHAGVMPGVPLDRQREENLLWIRYEFLNWPGDFGAVVVHGHTPVSQPEDLYNRIGIDTHAWASGRLTAVGLEGASRWFIST